MIQFFLDLLGQAQGWLFENAIQPLIYFTGMGDITEEAFEGTEWLLIGMAELLLIYLVLRPLEAAIPVHQFSDKRARWNDFIYTVLQRIGLVPLLLFFTLDPVIDAITGDLHMAGLKPFNLETWPPTCTRWPVSPSTWWCWTSPITGSIAPSTSSTGGGACTACTTASRT